MCVAGMRRNWHITHSEGAHMIVIREVEGRYEVVSPAQAPGFNRCEDAKRTAPRPNSH